MTLVGLGVDVARAAGRRWLKRGTDVAGPVSGRELLQVCFVLFEEAFCFLMFFVFVMCQIS